MPGFVRPIRLLRIRFFVVVILIRLLCNSFFVSRNDWGWPPGMDLLFAGGWRRVERVYDDPAYGLLRGVLRLGLAIPGFSRVVVLSVCHREPSTTQFYD